jgi:LmbE family N-acetylglucosaminyl deacetylase
VPAETFADARSHALPLDAAQVATKRDAHRAHRTQTVVMDGFLRSLRRENERFAVVEPDAVRRLDAGAVRCPTPPGGEPPPAHVRVR